MPTKSGFSLEYKHHGSDTWHSIGQRDTQLQADEVAMHWLKKHGKPGTTVRTVNPMGKTITETWQGLDIPKPVYAKVPDWVSDTSDDDAEPRQLSLFDEEAA